ncbi:hypothetical protein WAF17_12890 [Bernardetia sp. ABR2-2B]|uniref:hypothetical protein n=1 Tax=Bernardetia sp. ABR2-2B TaxID=3127472 RepID=UPI0030CFF7F5
MSKVSFGKWVIVLSLFLSSCGSSDVDYDNVNDVIDNCISSEPVENADLIDPCTGCNRDTLRNTPSKKIDNLNVYLEISGSMKGYMPKQTGRSTGFQKQMASLFSWFVTSTEAKGKKFYGIKDDQTTLEFESKDDVASKISRAEFEFGKTTTLPDLVEKIIRKNGQEDVSVIVSDFLYSPPNVLNLEGTLNVRLREMFLKRPEMALSVYAFKSDYSGKFYTVTNKVINNCCNDKRPYYVWVLGKQPLVSKIDKLIAEKMTFEEELHIGKKYGNIKGEILAHSGRDEFSTWQRKSDCPNIITEAKNISKEEKLIYTISLDLSKLPKQHQNLEYLKSNLRVSSSNSKSNITNIYTYKDFESKLTKEDVVLAKKYTHFVEIETSSVDVPNKTTLNLELQNSLPIWVENWNTESDETDAERNGKTVLLKRVISGIQEAHENETLFSYPYIITASAL